MTEPDNPRWRDALDRAVPHPPVPAGMLQRVDTAVAAAHRRRRWTAIVSTAAAVAVATVALGAVVSSGHAGPAAGPAIPSTRTRTSAPLSHPSLASPSPPSPSATQRRGRAPGAGKCTVADNPQHGETAAALRPLPADFLPTAAFLCSQDFKTYPGQGTWQVLVVQQLSGDLDALTSALRQPDVGAMPQPSASASQPPVVCAASFMIPPRLVLLDASGAAFRPRIPVDQCNTPQSELTSALRALRHSTVDVVKLQQTETQQQVDADRHAAAVGCQVRKFKDLLSYTSTDKLSKGGPLGWRGPVSLCLFADDPHDEDVGDFVDGRRLSAAEGEADRRDQPTRISHPLQSATHEVPRSLRPHQLHHGGGWWLLPRRPPRRPGSRRPRTTSNAHRHVPPRDQPLGRQQEPATRGRHQRPAQGCAVGHDPP